MKRTGTNLPDLDFDDDQLGDSEAVRRFRVQDFDPVDIRLTVTPSCFTQSALNPWFVAGGVLGLALAGGGVVWITALARKSREQGRQ
jgi:hypothetical protein